MYLLFVPAMAAVVVIGFIQLRDQFAKLSWRGDAVMRSLRGRFVVNQHGG